MSNQDKKSPFLIFQELPGINYKTDYPRVVSDILQGKKEGNEKKVFDILRSFISEDIFFFLYFIADIPAINNKWLYERCVEVQKTRNQDSLDVWSREHFKSTIISFALIVQDILKNPEERIGIGSHTRPSAKKFLRRIKNLFETNKMLRIVFPDIIPAKFDNKIQWSEDEGLTLLRKGTYQEPSIKAFGMDSLPTGDHYTILLLDDIENEHTISTPEQTQKSKDLYGSSLHLTSNPYVKRVVGTIYSQFGLMQELLETEGNFGVKRYYPGEVEVADSTGKKTLVPVYWDKKTVEKKRREHGIWDYSCQVLLKPIPEEEQTFKLSYIKYYDEVPFVYNYLLVDPADSKSKKSDYSAYWIIGTSASRKYYILDGYRGKLNLSERWQKILYYYEIYHFKKVGYEKYGKDSDIQYFEAERSKMGLSFPIVPLSGYKDKISNIKGLQPLFENGDILFPHTIMYKNDRGESKNLIHDFISEEFSKFPFSMKHDDMLDALRRISDRDMRFTFPVRSEEKVPKEYNPFSQHEIGDSLYKDYMTC